MEDKERTLWCGNLSEKVTEDLLYELFLQAGPLEKVTIPKDKEGRPRNFAFITFKHPVSVQYAVALMNDISLYNKALRLDARSSSAAENPYLQKLNQYMHNAQRGNFLNQGYYPQNDNRHQQYDSRYRNNNPMNNNPGVLFGYSQPLYMAPMLPQIPPPMVNMPMHYLSPASHNNRNSYPNYRY